MKDFNENLEGQRAKVVKAAETVMGERLPWATSARHDLGKLAKGNLETLFYQKLQEVSDAIRLLHERHIGEGEQLTETWLLARHKEILQSLLDRFGLMMKINAATEPSEKKDRTISSDAELYAFREQGFALIQNLDVQSLVYNSLPSSMQGSYLEAIGRSIGELHGDFVEILTKVDQNQELTPDDWKRLLDEVRKLGNEKTVSFQKSPVLVVLSLLKLKDRLEFLSQMAEDPTFTNFSEVLLTLTATTYVTVDQALQVLDDRIVHETDKEKLAELRKLRLQISGRDMQVTQAAMIERREEGVERLSRVSFGHKNRARGLLTLRGMGSLFLAANGAATIAANVLVNISDPLSLPGNPALWLGTAMLGTGLQWSKGFEGLVPTPTKLFARAIKDRPEEKDDRIQANLRNFREELGNRPGAAHFYATYAERIVTAYEKKKKENPGQKPLITLEDLGVKSKEDLPEAFQPLYEGKAALEIEISTWADRFHRKSGNGVAEQTAQGQRDFIQNARESRGLEKFKIHELPNP